LVALEACQAYVPGLQNQELFSGGMDKDWLWNTSRIVMERILSGEDLQ